MRVDCTLLLAALSLGLHKNENLKKASKTINFLSKNCTSFFDASKNFVSVTSVRTLENILSSTEVFSSSIGDLLEILII